jgi:hypothetical protein
MRKKKEIGLEEMTLKDFIAIFAMQSFISGWISRGTYPETDLIVSELAYKMADAMMETRNGN